MTIIKRLKNLWKISEMEVLVKNRSVGFTTVKSLQGMVTLQKKLATIIPPGEKAEPPELKHYEITEDTQ